MLKRLLFLFIFLTFLVFVFPLNKVNAQSTQPPTAGCWYIGSTHPNNPSISYECSLSEFGPVYSNTSPSNGCTGAGSATGNSCCASYNASCTGVSFDLARRADLYCCPNPVTPTPAPTPPPAPVCNPKPGDFAFTSCTCDYRTDYYYSTCNDYSSTFSVGYNDTSCGYVCPVAAPDCTSNISCGSCNLSTSGNYCSGNGIRSCTYIGDGTCKPVPAPNQTCNVNNCSAGYTCQNGSCTPPNPTCTPNGSCSAPAPSCETTTTGVDNCGNPCTKQGSACSTPTTCVPGTYLTNCTSTACGGNYCSETVQQCKADGSGYDPKPPQCTWDYSCGTCNTPTSTPTPTSPPSGQCNYGACGAAGGCASGSRYVSGSNCPSWYTNPGCYQDASCPSNGSGCVGPSCNVISDYACWETVSKDGTNWSTNSVSATGGETVYFKMDVKALKDSLSFYVRNKFDDLVDGYTNIYGNTSLWNNWVPGYGATPLRGMGDPSCWGWPGFCPDWHNYNASGDIENWGTGTGMTGNRASAWSVVVNSNASTFKNKPFVAIDGSISPGRNLQFGSCVPQRDPNLPGYNNGTCCWQDPASGGPTCIIMKTTCDGVPCNCNPAWGECLFGMTFQCNTVTVNTTLTISGYVKNSQTKAGIPNMTIRVYDDAFRNLPVNTQTATTDGSGHWQVANFVRPGDSYAVRVPGNSNTQTAPVGYAPPAKTSTLGWTWNYAANPNTDVPLGSGSYEGQVAGSNDCAGFNGSGVDDRCSFEYDPVAALRATITAPQNYSTATVSLVIPVSATATGTNLTKMEIWKSRTYPESWIQVGPTKSCGGASTCNITTNDWTPAATEIGPWYIAVNAYDMAGNQCTGNPFSGHVHAGWSACGPNDNVITIINPAGPGGSNTPWIQTTSGDVHSNTGINTPGGP